MNPSELFHFLKTRTGRLLAFAAVFAAGLVILSAVRHASPQSEAPLRLPEPTTLIADPPQVVHSVERPFEVFNPPAPVSAPSNPPPVRVGPASPATNLATRTLSPPPPALVLPPRPPPLSASPVPLSLFDDALAGVTPAKQRSPQFAPFGRLIPCETVITIDSSSLRTPIIGLVTENVFFDGNLLIPAGTEIHGTAQTDHFRERIASGQHWNLIWQSGKALPLKAIALDREFENRTNQTGWALTDGSAGLRGEIIKADQLADLKLFAATFLAGAAGALTEKQPSLFGPLTSPTLNNAPYSGAQAVLQTYAQQIMSMIQKDGFFVRVPSGKQFYLYVLQTIDLADASPGGGAPPDAAEKEEPLQP